MDRALYLVIAILIGAIISIVIYYEYKIRRFSSYFGKALDEIIEGEWHTLPMTQETLESKFNHKLKRLMEICQNTTAEAQKEKDDLKSLLGDISHQVKTPIANIKMYNNILIEREVPKEKQIAFLQLNNSEIDKLDFLIQAMIKMSRLENGVIQLQPKLCNVLQTLANALAGVSQKAEAKQIEIDLACDEKIEAYFDPKWTEEAIFNVIENAVKYTKDQDTLEIRVEVLEIYVVIHIIDHGIGIAEAEQGLIFRRFYRSPHVQHTEGVGVGLALAREMLTKQQGFIKVIAAPGEGSKFSIYLPKENLSKL